MPLSITVNFLPPKNGKQFNSKSNRVYVLKSIFWPYFFLCDFSVYLVTYGIKTEASLSCTQLVMISFVNIIHSLFLLKLIVGLVFVGPVFGRSALWKNVLKSAVFAATFKFWGVYVLGHILFGRSLGEFTVEFWQPFWLSWEKIENFVNK